MKRIMVLAIGGTILSVGEPGVTRLYRDGPMSMEEFASSIPGLDTLADLQFEQPFRVPSFNITSTHWLDLAKRINALVDEVDGFVIIHGTDTLEETAYFLTLTVKTDKPVVITGSMRPATASSPDGPLNFYQAVALAASDQARGRGVLVNFADGIFSGRDVQKVNSFRTQAFDQGFLGYMRDETVWFAHRTEKCHTLQTEFNIQEISALPKVGLAYYYTEADAQILDTVTSDAHGLVIAGSPCGSIGTNWKEKVCALTAGGMIVLRGSRVTNGIIMHDNVDIDTGTIPVGSLPPHKARILLMLALTKTNCPQEVSRMLSIY